MRREIDVDGRGDPIPEIHRIFACHTPPQFDETKLLTLGKQKGRNSFPFAAQISNQYSRNRDNFFRIKERHRAADFPTAIASWMPRPDVISAANTVYMPLLMI